jgi:hypothetical protein
LCAKEIHRLGPTIFKKSIYPGKKPATATRQLTKKSTYFRQNYLCDFHLWLRYLWCRCRWRWWRPADRRDLRRYRTAVSHSSWLGQAACNRTQSEVCGLAELGCGLAKCLVLLLAIRQVPGSIFGSAPKRELQ